MEKYLATKKTISRLAEGKGTFINDADLILKKIGKFYKELYTTTNSCDGITHYLDNLLVPKIDVIDSTFLDSPIMLDEIKIVIKQLKKNKCPSLDGFPIEFYQTFEKDLISTIHSLIIKICDSKQLNPLAMQGTISLLEKPSKDKLQLKNWHPLTMLCCDYKIFAKIVANRLQLVLPQIISKDQFGFMKGQNISENLLEVLSITEYCLKYKKLAFLMAIDFEKAFDKVEWPALTAVLKKIRFGQTFIDYVHICLGGGEFMNSVMNGGHRSDRFKVSRGLKQGCPLSPYLFLLMIEVIALKLKQNPKIKGLQNEEITKILGQFADDLWIVSEFDQDSFNVIMDTLNEFDKNTGLKINYNKTEVLRLGSLNKTNAKFYSKLPITWSNRPVQI